MSLRNAKPIEEWWPCLMVNEEFRKFAQKVRFDFSEYDNKFLSNFYGAPLLFRGKWYPDSEHAYQSAKCISKKEAENIRCAASAGICKRLGAECDKIANWDEIKNDIMMEVLCCKFSNPEMAQMLLGTGDDYIVEGNVWHDNHYGLCIKQDCKKCRSTMGMNYLGDMHMQLRKALRER